MKVLVVDDMHAARRNIIMALSKEGIAVVEAESGLEAILLYKKDKYDVIIMDLDMPDLNGITALKEIREINKDAKIIIASAYNDEENIEETNKYGAAHFLVKPFDLNKLVELVKTI